jgi:hypothetical protein
MDYYYDLYEEDPVRQYFYYLNSMIPWYWPSIKTTDTPWHADRIPNHKLIDGSKKLRLKDDSEFIRQRKIEHREVDHAADRVKSCGLRRDLDDVVVAVEVRALGLVVLDTVPTTELDTTSAGLGHG